MVDQFTLNNQPSFNPLPQGPTNRRMIFGLGIAAVVVIVLIIMFVVTRKSDQSAVDQVKSDQVSTDVKIPTSADEVKNDQSSTDQVKIEYSLATPEAETKFLVDNPVTDLPPDSDNDGLSDGLEAMFGTNPNNPDTDSDGYLDGDEVNNGYNPLGGGRGIKLFP